MLAHLAGFAALVTASVASVVILVLASRSIGVNQLIQADRSITAGSSGIVAESQIGSVKAQLRTVLRRNRQFSTDQRNGIVVCRILIRIQCSSGTSRADIVAAGSLDGIVAICLTLCDGNSIGLAGGNNAVSDCHILVVTLSFQGSLAGTRCIKDIAGSRALLVNDQVSTGPIRRSSSDLLPSGISRCRSADSNIDLVVNLGFASCVNNHLFQIKSEATLFNNFKG